MILQSPTNTLGGYNNTMSVSESLFIHNKVWPGAAKIKMAVTSVDNVIKNCLW